jgi:hypothetical protein
MDGKTTIVSKRGGGKQPDTGWTDETHIGYIGKLLIMLYTSVKLKSEL